MSVYIVLVSLTVNNLGSIPVNGDPAHVPSLERAYLLKSPSLSNHVELLEFPIAFRGLLGKGNSYCALRRPIGNSQRST